MSVIGVLLAFSFSIVFCDIFTLGSPVLFNNLISVTIVKVLHKR